MRRLLGLACALLVFPAPAFAEESARPPEALLAGDSVAYFRFDGLEPHRKVIDQSILAEVMKGDLGDFSTAIVRLIQDSLGVGTVKEKLLAGLPPEQLVKIHQSAKHLPRLVEYFQHHGFVAGVEVVAVSADSPPRAQLTVVFPQAGLPQNRDAVFAGLQLFVELNHVPLVESKHAGRTIFHTWAGTDLDAEKAATDKDRAPQLACWQEGEHIVLTFGTEKPKHLLTLIGDKPRANLTTNPLFQSVAGFDRYTSIARGFVDLELGLKKVRRLGLPADAVIHGLGLTGLKNLTFHTGFSGRYQQTSLALNLTGKRTGLLRLIPSAEVSLDRLPPLPPDALGVTAVSLDVRGWADTAVLIKGVMDGVSGEKITSPFAEIDKALGIDVRKDFLEALGSTAVLYTSPGEGFTFLGMGLAVEVKDPAKLQTTLATLQKALFAADETNVRKMRYQGVDIFTTRKDDNGFPMAPSWAVHNGWLVAGMSPQTVKGHILRSKGRYTAWQPAPLVRETLSEIKKNPRAKILGVSAADPRSALKQAVALSGILITGISRGGEDTIDQSLLPHFQSLTEPLAPNIMVLVDDGDSVRLETKGSLPLPTDILGMDSTFMLMLFARF